MNTAIEFTLVEQEAVNKIENYFKCKEMTLQEKLFHALLIAQHDLELHNYTNKTEEIKIIEFKLTIDSLLLKLRHKAKE